MQGVASKREEKETEEQRNRGAEEQRNRGTGRLEVGRKAWIMKKESRNKGAGRSWQ